MSRRMSGNDPNNDRATRCRAGAARSALVQAADAFRLSKLERFAATEKIGQESQLRGIVFGELCHSCPTDRPINALEALDRRGRDSNDNTAMVVRVDRPRRIACADQPLDGRARRCSADRARNGELSCQQRPALMQGSDDSQVGPVNAKRGGGRLIHRSGRGTKIGRGGSRGNDLIRN